MSEVSVDPNRIIHVMPETLANKIAAGEVVQRPASVAKELIENALDAGADQITVVLKAAGSELVQIIDNGCGMSNEDALLSFRRHATSKIRSIEDLERIHTFGFRGEALASVAAVAQVELKTKRMQDEVGFRIRIDGGKVVTSEPCATPEGTSLAVRNLFYNVPARRNFLKTPATEFKHLVETFQFLALANPSVAFSLFHDDNEVYRLTPLHSEDPQARLRHRVGELLGNEYAESCVFVEETTSYLSMTGVVSKPEFHRRSRGEQFLFVNGRYIKNRSLDHAVLHAYEGLVPSGSFPFYSLFLWLDPRHVDVNVHPTKAEIKFDDERGIYGFVKAVVRKALSTADLSPQLDLNEQKTAPVPSFKATDLSPQSDPPRSLDLSRPTTSPAPVSFQPASESTSYASPSAFFPQSSPPEAEPSPMLPFGDLSDKLYKPTTTEETVQLPAGATLAANTSEEQPERSDGEPLLWQLHNRYIITQIRSGLMILDQQAAHERILYERALQSLKSGLGMSQQLLFPHTLDFSPIEHELLKELLPDLLSLGFDIELFSGRSAVVRGVPAEILPGDDRNILSDILQQYKTYQGELQIKGRENLARSIASRSAIRGGTRLSNKEMRTLIDQLFLCEMPYASPHGRPTMIKIPIEELDKRFGKG